jgi:hypothetical protein
MIPLGYESSIYGPRLCQDTRDVRASGIAGTRRRWQRTPSAKPNERRSRGRGGSIERFDMI